jgi:hypothetical protein
VSSLTNVSDVPADQPTWLTLLKVEHRGKINKKIQLKKFTDGRRWTDGNISHGLLAR